MYNFLCKLDSRQLLIVDRKTRLRDCEILVLDRWICDLRSLTWSTSFTRSRAQRATQARDTQHAQHPVTMDQKAPRMIKGRKAV